MRAVLPVRPWAEAKEAFQIKKAVAALFVVEIDSSFDRHCPWKRATEKGNVVLRTLFQIVKDPVDCDLFLVSCSLSFASWFFAAMNRGGGLRGHHLLTS
jgi:hypothetical protein